MTRTKIDPQQFDTELAELHRDLSQIERRALALVEQMHYLVGDRKRYVGRKQRWDMSAKDVLAKARAATGSRAAELFEQHEHLQDAHKRTLAEIVRRDSIYREQPWSRFFEVTSSNGHVHSSMHCSTCRVTTSFGWHPQLSGKSEAEAVAELGPLLCSVCFVSAPVEWKRDRADIKREQEQSSGLYCEGRGTYGRDIKWRSSPWGTCTVCEQSVSVTSTGMVRKHKLASK